MLKLENVTKTYKMRSGEVHALSEVSLELPRTGMVFILGKSGCGKSTLLNIIGGLDERSSGEIIIDDESMANYKAADYDSYRNRYIGFIFQEYNLIDDFNVGKNIGLALELQGVKDKKSMIDNALAQVGLEGCYRRKVSELSGGQKQRVATARALVKKPRIILADEPTGNLDSMTAEEIFNLLKALSSDRLVLVVSHDRESAEKYGDRIIELSDGEVISDIDKVQVSQEVQQVELSVIDERKAVNTGRKSRGNLPIGSAFSYAFTNLYHKKFRVIASIVLFIIALSIFSFAYGASRYNVYDTTYNAFEDAGYDYANLQSKYVMQSFNYIENEFKENAVPVYYDYSYIVDFPDIDNVEILPNESGYYDTSFGYSMPIDNQIMSNMGFNILYGRLPGNSAEVCLTKYKAESMLFEGKAYWDYIGVNSIEEMIGKVYDRYNLTTVVGIIDTNFPAKYDVYRDKTYEEMSNNQDNLFRSFSEQTTATAHVSLLRHASYFKNNYISCGVSFGYKPATSDRSRRLQGFSDSALDTLNIDYELIKKDTEGVIVMLETAKDFIRIAGLWDIMPDDSLESVKMVIASYRITVNMNYNVNGDYYNFNEEIIGVFSEDRNDSIYLTNAVRTKFNNNIPCMRAFLIDMDDRAAINRAIDVSSLVNGSEGNNILLFNNDIINSIDSATLYAGHFNEIGGAAAIAFCVIVVLLLLNYFLSTIKDKNREIGILRAIGVKNSNVMSIYILEAMIICILSFAISLPIGFAIANWLETIVMNSNLAGYKILVHFIDMGAVTCLVTFALCIGVALIGCIAPFVKLFRKKPMEIMRKH